MRRAWIADADTRSVAKLMYLASRAVGRQLPVSVFGRVLQRLNARSACRRCVLFARYRPTSPSADGADSRSHPLPHRPPAAARSDRVQRAIRPFVCVRQRELFQLHAVCDCRWMLRDIGTDALLGQSSVRPSDRPPACPPLSLPACPSRIRPGCTQHTCDNTCCLLMILSGTGVAAVAAAAAAGADLIPEQRQRFCKLRPYF